MVLFNVQPRIEICLCLIREFGFNFLSTPDPPDHIPPLSLSAENLLLQGTHLRNTEFVIGVAVYTGMETKLGMNKGQPRMKITKIDHLVNRVTVFIFLFQLCLVLILGIIGDALQYSTANSHSYLYSAQDSDVQSWYGWLLIPARFLLLNSTFIPISLKVTVDVCKIFYGRWIEWDLNMWNQSVGFGATAQSTAICEDLGQVGQWDFCFTVFVGADSSQRSSFLMRFFPFLSASF